MKIKTIKIENLIPYEKNAKIHTEKQVEQLASAIAEFGFRVPLLVKKNKGNDYEVVAGHGSLLAAKKLAMEELPCHDVSELTENQIKALRIADNKLNESGWDNVLLVEELETLDVELQELTGVNIEDLPDFEPKNEEVRLDVFNEKKPNLCDQCKQLIEKP